MVQSTGQLFIPPLACRWRQSYFQKPDFSSFILLCLLIFDQFAIFIEKTHLFCLKTILERVNSRYFKSQ